MKKAMQLLFIIWLFLMGGSLVPAAAAQSPCGQSYTVVYGDTLRDIARRCNTSLSALLAANPAVTNPDRIFVGQPLTIPGPPPDQSRSSYTIAPGDNLRMVARRFDTSVSTLLALNPQIVNPDLIYANQQLTLPAGQKQSPVSVTLSPTSGPPGTTVQLTGSGFPPDAPLEIGLGRKNTEFGVVEQGRTDDSGRLDTRVTIPEFADPHEPWVAVVSPLADPGLEAISNDFAVTAPQAEAPVFDTVQLYLVALNSGQLGCGDQLVAVDRDIAPTQTPLTAAMQELLSIDEQSYGQSGLYNALSASNLQVESIELNNGQADIYLTGELSMGGVCDAPRLEAQLRETARQFETVNRVQLFVNGEPLTELTSARD